jgi:hypothetical protein
MGGRDSHPVNSRETPWQSLDRLNEIIFNPGDSVLLRAGESWEGQLVLNGSGTEKYPITLSSYGEGPRPKIDGNGAVGAVITLEDISHWCLSNLEITSPASGQASRLGVLITANGGSHGHFHLESLLMHDIFGRYSFEMIGKNTGGIGIIGDNNTRFDNILTENCETTDIVRVGIFTNGNKGTRGERPITNLVIRNNTVSRCAGDGMIIRYAHKPLIEYNVAVEDHNAAEELVEYGVIIWVKSTDEAVIRHNRVFDTRGSMDGQAFDADLEAYHTLVQYIYSRSNEGGFMLVYGSSQDAIVRYNISQNDGAKEKHILDFSRWVSPRGSGIIHNNIYYIGEGIEAVLVNEALGTAKLYNNIVINKGGGALVIRSDGQTAGFSHNCPVGYPSSAASANQNPVEGDPGLVDPGSGEEEISSLDGYLLSPGSTCLHAGLPLSQMKGNYWFDGEMTDFWGNPVNPESLDVGVHQLSDPTITGIQLLPGKGMISWEVAPVPFTEDFSLMVNVPSPMEVYIKIYDMAGRYIDTLFSGELTLGRYTLYFSMVDRSKPVMRSGIYFVQLTAPEFSLVESMKIIRN